MLDGLDEELAGLGFTEFDVQLPGRQSEVAPLEGALRLDQLEDGFALRTVDYGRAYTLGVARTEAEARELLLAYVSRPLPPIVPMTRDQLDELADKLAPHYFDVRDRATAAGDAGIVIDLPPGLPADRIGALDGVQLFPIDTPFELRSLPPNALRPENDVHQFVTGQQVRVRAQIVPPWFGRSGGGIRFELQQPGTGIRDLVITEALLRIHVS